MILGVDSGGSKTKAILVDRELNLLGVGVNGPGNIHDVGDERARKNILEAINKALSEAGGGLMDIRYGGFGISGVDTDKDRDIMSNSLADLEIAGEKFIVNDVVMSHYSSVGGGPGVTVVGGSGSKFYGRNDREEETKMGGWGWLVGDEGSGFQISRRGIQEATKAYDGRREDSVLVDFVLEHFDLERFEEVISRLHEGLGHPKEISSFSKRVVEASEMGDDAAEEVIEEACREIFIGVRSAKENLDIKEPFKVGLTGGIFNSERILERVKGLITEEYPGTKVLRPMGDPVVGSIALAMDEMGQKYSREGLEMLGEKLRDRGN